MTGARAPDGQPPIPEAGELSFRTYFESLPVATLVLDLAYRILAASDHFLAATMTRREEIVGRHVLEVFRENPDDPQGRGQGAWRASLDRVRREGKPHRMTPLRYDIPRPEDQGGGFEVRAWAPVNYPIFDEDGAVCAILHQVEDITEERRLREERDAQNRDHALAVERFQVLIRATQVAVWDWDLRDNEIQWSENVLEAYGHEPEAMRSPESWLGAIHEEDRTRVERSIMRCVERDTGPSWAEEYRFRRGDGSTAYVYDRGLLIHDDAGEPVRMIGSMQDISARVEAEWKVASLVEHQRVLAELASFAVSEQNLYTVMEEAARRVSEVLGVKYAKVLEKLPDEDNLVVRAVSGFSLDLVDTFRVPARGRSQAGFTFQMNSTTRVRDFEAENRFEIPDIPGYGLRGGIAAVIEGAEQPWGVLQADCVEPREFSDAEAAFVETAANVLGQAVERSAFERQLRYQATLLDAVGQSILALNGEGTIVYWNRHAESLHGWSPREVLGQNVLDLVVPADERERAAAAIEDVLKGRDRAEAMKLSRKDRSFFDAQVSIVPVRDERGIITGAIMASIDLTERIQLEEKLRQAQKMEAVGRLAGGVAHDFNNLLTVISGHSELLLEEVESANARESMEQIAEAAAKAGSLTAQLLAFSRQQVIQPRDVLLGETVRRMEKLLRRVIGADLDLVLTEKGDIPGIVADQTQVEQVILNLAVNARDAMPLGGTLTISVEGRRLDRPLSLGHVDLPPGRYALLSVRDTGSGIPPEAKPHVFEPFFTTKEQGKGTGLGLATVFGIVQQSGGGIHVDSVAGTGTSISIYFPEGKVPKDAADVRPEDEAPLRLDGRTILIVEDDTSVRALLSRVLPRLGAEVLQATNGIDALRIFRENEGAVDLVLTDLIMPGMGGMELASRVKQDRPDFPILFMSGYSSDLMSNQEVLPDGVLLRKPFSARELAVRVKEALHAEAGEGETRR